MLYVEVVFAVGLVMRLTDLWCDVFPNFFV